MRVPSGGGDPEFVLMAPIERGSISDIAADGRQMVVTVSEGQTDLWLVDNFDPDLSVTTGQ